MATVQRVASRRLTSRVLAMTVLAAVLAPTTTAVAAQALPHPRILVPSAGGGADGDGVDSARTRVLTEAPLLEHVTANWGGVSGTEVRYPASATSVRLTVPAEVSGLPDADPGNLEITFGWKHSGTYTASDAIRWDGWDIVADLPQALAELPARANGTLAIYVDQRLLGTAHRVTLQVALVPDPTLGSAGEFAALLDPALIRYRYDYNAGDVRAFEGKAVTLVGPPGFWNGSHVTVWQVGYNYSTTQLVTQKQVSADGSELTVVLPSGDPGLLDIGVGRDATIEETAWHEDRVLLGLLPGPDEADLAWLDALYRELLGRLGTSVEIVNWWHPLLTGTSHYAVASAITSSTEFRTHLVEAAYTTYLGRGPDPAGLRSWLAAMGRGTQIQEVEAGFLASDEYFARSGHDLATWVADLYRHVLGRSPGASEVAAWVRAARSAGRYQVALGFLYSTEHLASVVEGYYRTYLGRGLDAAGRDGWVRAIQAGYRVEAIVAGIVASPEYRGRFPGDGAALLRP